MIRVAELRFYPVKSCRGLSVPELSLDRWGPHDDRRFMLVDDAGRFLSQREHHRLALLEPRLEPGRLFLTAPGMPDLAVELSPRSQRSVTVWRYSGGGHDFGADASGWCTRFLGSPAHLVGFDDADFRPANPAHSPEGSSAGRFSDGYPVLLTSAASLADLNRRIVERGGAAVPMVRFRPNLVVEGGAPFAEDSWKTLRVGSATFFATKPCERCVITTIDQETGVAGKEPLATLATFRRAKEGGAVLFGSNLVHAGPGTVRVGDAVEVLG